MDISNAHDSLFFKDDRIYNKEFLKVFSTFIKNIHFYYRTKSSVGIHEYQTGKNGPRFKMSMIKDTDKNFHKHKQFDLYEQFDSNKIKCFICLEDTLNKKSFVILFSKEINQYTTSCCRYDAKRKSFRHENTFTLEKQSIELPQLLNCVYEWFENDVLVTNPNIKTDYIH